MFFFGSVCIARNVDFRELRFRIGVAWLQIDRTSQRLHRVTDFALIQVSQTKLVVSVGISLIFYEDLLIKNGGFVVLLIRTILVGGGEKLFWTLRTPGSKQDGAHAGDG